MSSHRNRTSRLGVKTGHRTAMIRNLTLGLVEHGRIKTTVARAKRMRPFVEKLVTRLKDPTVANLRVAVSLLNNRDAVLTIAKDIAPKFATRPGGYTRILKLAGARAGDAADMALIEWVEESLVGAYNEEKKAKPAAKKTVGKSKAKGKSAPKAEKAEKAEKKAKAKAE